MTGLRIKKLPGFLLILVFLSVSPSVSAQVYPEEGIAKCSQTVSRVERLICYDDLATKLGHVPPDQAGREEEILESYGFWTAAKRVNAANETIVYLKNDAVEEIISRTGRKRKPTLTIKCRSGNTEVYLDWKSVLSTGTFGMTLPVTARFNSGIIETTAWELSTDRQALFVPEPVDFVKQMRQNTRLILQFTPGNDLMQTIVHDITGLDPALNMLVAECYN